MGIDQAGIAEQMAAVQRFVSLYLQIWTDCTNDAIVNTDVLTAQNAVTIRMQISSCRAVRSDTLERYWSAAF